MPTHAEALLEKYGTAIELEFVRAASSGKVHILPPSPPERDRECEEIPWADLGEIFAKRHPMLCRTNLHLEEHGGRSFQVRCFADEDLCASCVRELGSQSARAFEHPQPVRQKADMARPDERPVRLTSGVEGYRLARLAGRRHLLPPGSSEPIGYVTPASGSRWQAWTMTGDPVVLDAADGRSYRRQVDALDALAATQPQPYERRHGESQS